MGNILTKAADWPKAFDGSPIAFQLGRFQIGNPDDENFVVRLVLIDGEIRLALSEDAKKYVIFYPA